jgi:hypothetical protein
LNDDAIEKDFDIWCIAGGYSSDRLSTKEVAHINFLFFGSGGWGRSLLLLLLLFGRSFFLSFLCSHGGSCGFRTRSSKVKKGADVLALEGLSEDLGPVGFDLDSGGSDEFAEFVTYIYIEVPVISWSSSWRIKAA